MEGTGVVQIGEEILPSRKGDDISWHQGNIGLSGGPETPVAENLDECGGTPVTPFVDGYGLRDVVLFVKPVFTPLFREFVQLWEKKEGEQNRTGQTHVPAVS